MTLDEHFGTSVKEKEEPIKKPKATNDKIPFWYRIFYGYLVGLVSFVYLTVLVRYSDESWYWYILPILGLLVGLTSMPFRFRYVIDYIFTFALMNLCAEIIHEVATKA